MRWDNRPKRSPRPDDMVIDAFVGARLLGLKLLTLEARIVLGKEHGLRQVVQARALDPVAGHQRRRPAALAPVPEYAVPGVAGGPELDRARELLAEGEDTLARSRRRQLS